MDVQGVRTESGAVAGLTPFADRAEAPLREEQMGRLDAERARVRHRIALAQRRKAHRRARRLVHRTT